MVQMSDDEAAHHMLWVGRDGEVHIDPLPHGEIPAVYAKQHEPEMKFRYETLQRGNDNVGEHAAQDDGYVGMLFNQLTRSWASGASGYIECP